MVGGIYILAGGWRRNGGGDGGGGGGGGGCAEKASQQNWEERQLSVPNQNSRRDCFPCLALLEHADCRNGVVRFTGKMKQ